MNAGGAGTHGNDSDGGGTANGSVAGSGAGSGTSGMAASGSGVSGMGASGAGAGAGAGGSSAMTDSGLDADIDAALDAAIDAGVDANVDADVDVDEDVDAYVDEDDDSAPPLDAPTGLVASDGTDSSMVLVTWDAVADAESYEISIDGGDWESVGALTEYQDLLAPLGTFDAPTPVAADGTHADHVDLSIGSVTLIEAVAREYRVRAVVGDRYSEPSDADSGYRLVTGPLSLQWQRSSGSTASDFADLPGATMADWTDTTIAAGAARHYRVVLSASGAATLATDADLGYRALSAPGNVQASDGVHTTGVVVTWTAVPNATGYEVHDGFTWTAVGNVTNWLDTNAPLGYIEIGDVTASDGQYMAMVEVFTDSVTIEPGGPRTYKVRAIGESFTGPESATDTGQRGIGAWTWSLQRSSGDSPAGFSQVLSSPMTAIGNSPWNSSGIAATGEFVMHDETLSKPIDPQARYYRFEVQAPGATSAISAADRGYASARATRSYSIRVRTSDITNAGTDECVQGYFFGESYGLFQSSVQQEWDARLSFGKAFDNDNHNDLERNQTDNYSVSTQDIGEIRCLRLQIYDCDGSDGINGWHGRDVRVTDDLGRSWTFPVNAWLDSGGGNSTSRYFCL